MQGTLDNIGEKEYLAETTKKLIKGFKGMEERGTTGVINLLLEGAELKEEQINAVVECYTKTNLKGIISMEMGTGKTYVSIGLLQVARALMPTKKAIVTVPKNKVSDFRDLISSALNCRVLTVTGQQKDIDRLIRNFDDVDVIVAQSSFWTHSLKGQLFMYNNAHRFGISFYDEASGLEATGFKTFLEFSRYIPISFLANATPIGVDTRLVRNLLYGVGATALSERSFKSRYSSYNKTTRSSTTNPNRIKEDFEKYFINLNRSDIGLVAGTDITFHRLELTDYQRYWMQNGIQSNLALYSPETSNADTSLFTKEPILNPITVTAFARLQELVLRFRDTKKIIHISNTASIIRTKELLTMMGYKVYIMDGKHTPKEEDQKREEERYNADPNGVMLTNLIKGSNLETSNHIIVYDTPSDMQQLIFRAIRGIQSKTIRVDWMYYPEEEMNTLKKVLIHANNVSTLLEREIDLISQVEAEIGYTRSYKEALQAQKENEEREEKKRWSLENGVQTLDQYRNSIYGSNVTEEEIRLKEEDRLRRMEEYKRKMGL